MAPAGGKRKRSERQPSQDGAGRPSPHRPENLPMAQQGEARGGRTESRRSNRRQSKQGSAASPIDGANNTPLGARNAASPSPAAQQAPKQPSKASAAAAEDSTPGTPAPSSAPAVQPPQSLAETAVEPSSEPSVPFLYEHLTDEVVEQWQESGKATVQTIANQADEVMVITLLEELVRSSLDGRLAPSEAGSIIRAMVAHHAENESLDVVNIFLNVVSVFSLADHGNPHLLSLLTASNIDPDVIRRELDVDLLKSLPLVRSSFTQMRTRKTTNILYRQANFNLLREESEGYAKLVTEYFNTANEAINNHDVSVEDAFQRIMALVGSFDLDVGRVLDVTLDISAAMLVRAYPFFIKFYRSSSWWPAEGLFDDMKYEEDELREYPRWLLPGVGKGMSADEIERMKEDDKRRRAPLKEERDARFWADAAKRGVQPFYEIGARKIKNFDAVLPLLETVHRKEFGAKDREVNVDRRKRIDADREYMKATGFIPPQGNADAAQVLGFKLAFYGSKHREATDTLPENLVYLAALLIKTGFISLRDLYPHLYPLDADMPAEKARLEKEKADNEAKSRPGAAKNALAMAGALTDDTIPAVRNLRPGKEGSGASTPKQEKKDDDAAADLPTPANQKLMLLKALLAIGALPESLYILGRFPWLVDLDDEMPAYLHRIAKTMLSKLADSVAPMHDRRDLQEPRALLADKAAQADGHLSRKSGLPPKVTRWFKLEEVDEKSGEKHRHYYPDWDDNIPVCQTVDDVFTLCNTFLGFLGVKIGQDAQVLGTLIRIAKHSLTIDFSDDNKTRWLDLMRRLLVPALSLSKHNAGLSQSVYELLKFFPTTTRYDIYAEWYQGKTSRLPDMRAAFDFNRAEVKDVLRRVTNETGKKQARALEKVSLSSPGVVMMTMINQLESYSNMIPSLVECCRYFSLLAYDVLTWCLINSLGGQGRDRINDDGMLTSPWLQALSHFVASLFRQYSILNPSPVLQYLAFELRTGDTTDLDVLEKLLNEMAGIRSDIDFNDSQVLAMAGGEHLRALTVQQLHDKRHIRKDKLARLMKALADPGLTGTMLVAIAQERRVYSHHISSKFMPLKVLGSNMDKLSKILMQYLEALKTSLRPEDFQEKIPDVVALIGDYGLEPGIAFTIYRTVLLHQIGEHDAARALETDGKKRTLSQQSSNVDVEMKEGAAETSKATEVIEEGETSEGNAESSQPNGDLKQPPTPRRSAASIVNSSQGPWHPVLEPLIQEIPGVAQGLSERVSIPFFVTFWTLSLQDILVHTASYDAEIKRLRAQASELVPSNRSNLSALAIKENERKRQALQEMQDKLNDELKGRIGTYQKTRNRLSKSEKDHWFARSMNKADLDAKHLGLLQECFLPRAMLSSLDAHYCFLMLKMLHDNGTPGFSVSILLGLFFKKQQLAAIIFQCTNIEAAYFGRFLCEVLKLLQHWHADKTAYEKEALGAGKQGKSLPGFAVKRDANGKPETHLEYEDFRRLLYNWHQYLTGALMACFESDEFMHIRNGILILQAITPVFPAVTFMGKKLSDQLTKVGTEDKRDDLKLNANSLLGLIKHREKSWMMPQAFRLNDSTKEGNKAASRQPSTRPETPQPEKTVPKLSATAPDLKPTSMTNGTSRKESIAGKEDGEVEDEKQVASKPEDVKMSDGPAKNEANTEDKEPERPSSAAPEKSTPKPAPVPETPSGVPSKPPPRETLSRSRSSLPGHNLPDRPERADMRPSLTKPLPTPLSDRGPPRYSARPEDSYGRLDRPSGMRPTSRDHSPSRSRPRSPAREVRDPYYSSRGPPRDQPRGSADPRYSRDDGWSGQPRREPLSPPIVPGGPSSYASRDSWDGRTNGMMGPPTTQERRPDRDLRMSSAASSGPPANSRPASSAPQAQGSQPSTPHSENPARLAMITKEDPRHGSVREAPRDVRSERHTTDERSHDGRTVPNDVQREPSTRIDHATEHAPNGPRRTRSRIDLGPQNPPENSYGRLNGPSDAPSGPARVPNGPSGRGGRAVSSQQPPAPSRPAEPPVPSPSVSRPADSSAPPRGPGARAPHQPDRRNSGAQFDRQPSSSATATARAADSGPAIHPDRLAALEKQTTPIQTNLAAQGSYSASSPASATPTGPRGSNAPSRAPMGPAAGAPPSGPQSLDRQRRQGGQLADINATIANSQGTNGPGMNFKGAAQARQSVPASSANAQPVQSVASSMDPASRQVDQGVRYNDRSAPSRGDLFGRTLNPNAGALNHGGTRAAAEHEERHRSSRHSGRPEDVPPARPPPQQPHDDRRGERRGRDDPPLAARASRGDERPPRAAPADLSASYGVPAPPEWQGRLGDRRGLGDDQRRSGRISTRPDEYNRPGRREGEGGRGVYPPSGPAPMPRGDGPRGRKRPYEEGGSFEEDKRRRSMR